MNNSLRLASQLIVGFLKETIIGHERGLYRAKYHDPPMPIVHDVSLRELNNHTRAFIQETTMRYFNQLYDSLVKRNDNYVSVIFDRCQKLIDHSPVCLIIVIFKSCMRIHLELNRNLSRYS